MYVLPSSIIKSIMCNSKLLKRLIIPVFCRPILSQLILSVFRCDYLETYFILKKLLKPIIKYRDSWIVIGTINNYFQVYIMMHFIWACYCFENFFEMVLLPFLTDNLHACPTTHKGCRAQQFTCINNIYIDAYECVSYHIASSYL